MPTEPSARHRTDPSPFVKLPGRNTHAQLPAPLSTLIGREREAEETAELVRDPAIRLVTLTGPGGVGKTRLALRIAASAASTFSDGVVFVDLTPVRDPELVMPAIAQALGLRRTDDRPALAALQDALRFRESLVVLDNFEQVIDAAGQVSDLLQVCPRLTALVTSRALLNLSGERMVAVTPLTAPQITRRGTGEGDDAPNALLAFDAVRLFVERSQAVRPTFALTVENARSIAEICARLDGLPLAIEMAASRILLFSPEALLARLDLRLPLLSGGPRDLPERQRTIRDTIAWSYDLLEPAERSVLRRLAVFVGGCTFEAAEAVCAEPADAPDPAGVEFTSLVESLIHRSLLQMPAVADTGRAPRLTMLETIREFAAEQLAASGEEFETSRRHATYYLAFAHQVNPAFWGDMSGDWRAMVEAERANLHAALGWAMTHRETDIALQLASTLFDPYAMTDAYRPTGEDLRGQKATLQRALALPGGSDASRGTALIRVAWLAEALGSFDEGRTLAEEALTLLRAGSDEPGVATAEFVLGRFALRAGDLEDAERWLDDALAGFLALGANGRAAWTLCSLASVDRSAAFLANGDAMLLARAATRCNEALAIFQATNHLPGITRVLFELSQLAFHQDDLSRSLTLLHELLTMAWEHRQMVHPYLDDIARIASRTGQPEVAARLTGAAIEERQRDGVRISPTHQTQIEREMDTARQALGDTAFARELAAGRALPLEQAVAEALAFAAAMDAAPKVALTPREEEILPLLIDGKTARQIGETLYLSHRTVEHHIANIYAKLGVRTRAEVASAALDAGLLRPRIDAPTE